jgi:hypothetical protein
MPGHGGILLSPPGERIKVRGTKIAPETPSTAENRSVLPPNEAIFEKTKPSDKLAHFHF